MRSPLWVLAWQPGDPRVKPSRSFGVTRYGSMPVLASESLWSSFAPALMVRAAWGLYGWLSQTRTMRSEESYASA